MREDNVIKFVQPGEFTDELTEILRKGAQTPVKQAVEEEFATFLESRAHERLDDGRKRVVRHGHLPERKVVMGIGCIPVKALRSRDRKGHQGEDTIRFTSRLQTTI